MNALKREIATNIAHDGPITLEHYMGLCLGHPQHGYYMTREPFGVAGDFVTAPEISQMFGELIGVWLAEAWKTAGGPAPANLIELGPGRGTLMSDILRVARIAPDFLDAVHPCLVEMSPRLRDIQHRTLANVASHVSGQVLWTESFATTPPGPAFVVANEFFDALPVRHYVKTLAGWRQRLIGLDQAGCLAFGLSEKIEPTLTAQAREGSIIEVCPAGQRLMSDIAQRLVAEGGVLLLIDYGYTQTSLGDSLQAVSRHSYVEPLDSPGEADLTAHVDFAALARAALAQGAKVMGPVTQAQFLLQLGIERRAETLSRNASPEQTQDVMTSMDRLIGTRDPQRHMGALFKVMAVAHPGMPDLPGFL